MCSSSCFSNPSLQPCLTHPQIFTPAWNWTTHPVQRSLSHTVIKNLHISTTFSNWQLTLLVADLGYCYHSLTSTSQLSSRNRSFTHHALTPGTVFLKSFANLYFTHHLCKLPIMLYQSPNRSLSLYLSFTPGLRLISSTNNSRHIVCLTLILWVLCFIRPDITSHFPFTIIVTVSLIHLSLSAIRPITFSVWE